MRNVIRTLSVAAIVAVVFSTLQAFGDVTKTRLGSLKKTDYVVTDVTGVTGGGTGIVDTATLYAALTNMAESGYIVTSNDVQGLRHLTDMGVYRYSVSTNGPWTWSCTNSAVFAVVKDLLPVYSGGHWTVSGELPAGLSIAQYGQESSSSASVTIRFLIALYAQYVDATATRPQYIAQVDGTLATWDEVVTAVRLATNAYDQVVGKIARDTAQYATNIWITLDSYIDYLEDYATNNYMAARLANYRALRLELWQQSATNTLAALVTTQANNTASISTKREKTDNTSYSYSFTPWVFGGGASGITDLSLTFTQVGDDENVGKWEIKRGTATVAVTGNTEFRYAVSLPTNAWSVSGFAANPTADRSLVAVNGDLFATYAGVTNAIATLSPAPDFTTNNTVLTETVKSGIAPWAVAGSTQPVTDISGKQDNLPYTVTYGLTNYTIGVTHATTAEKLKSDDSLSVIGASGEWVTRTNATKGVAFTNKIATVAAAQAMTNAVMASVSEVSSAVSQKRDLTNNVCIAAGSVFGAWSTENLPAGVTWDAQPFLADDGRWTWHYVDGDLEGYSQGGMGDDDGDTLQTFVYGEGFTATREVIAVAISNDVFTTYAGVTNAIAKLSPAPDLTTNNTTLVNTITNVAVAASVVDGQYVAYQLAGDGTRTAVTVGTRPELSEVQEWSSSKTYLQNDVVKHEGVVYICTASPDETVAASAWSAQLEKWKAVSIGHNSFSSGSTNVASGVGTHAEGGAAHAEGTFAHAEGVYTRADGVASHSEGTSTRAYGTFTHAEGISSAAGGLATHAEGSTTATAGIAAHAEGLATTASGLATHAEGNATKALGNFTHAEGAYTVAGRVNTTNLNSASYGSAAFAGGYGAVATNQTAFVWQGVATNVEVTATPADSAKYYDHGAGTFSINPVGGLLGLWIGGTNMYDWIVKSSPPVVLPQYWAWGSITNASGEVVTAEKIGAIPSSSLVDATPADAGEAGKNYAASLRYVQNNAVFAASSNYVKKVEVGGNIIDFTLGNNDTVSYNPSFSMTYPDTMVYKDQAETYITTWGNGSHITAAMIEGAVPSSRKVNGVALSNDVTVTVVSDRYALPSPELPSYSAASKNMIYRYSEDGSAAGTRYQIAEEDGWRVLATTNDIPDTSGLAPKDMISADNVTFSNQVLAVGLGIDTNLVAVISEFKESWGDFPLDAGDTATSIGTLLAALAAAIAWLKKNKQDKVSATTGLLKGGGSSGSIVAAAPSTDYAIPTDLPYSYNTTATLQDRAFNSVTLDGTTYNLTAALAAVVATKSGAPRDLIIVVTATAATTISFTAGTIKGDTPTVDGIGTWLIALTEYATGTWYCKQKKMEDAS